ncbi:MAG: ribosome small subunit-dependent GTPase A, partial [Lentimicrobium sp.]|nr:ribosome small subunit-dependent GTPase A [Lentimicrobium sp.]
TFDMIVSFAQNCRYKDCTHTTETNCAVLKAVEEGKIDQSSYENYLKMGREKAHFESTVAEKRKKEKIFGKILKDYFDKDIKNRKG